MKRFLLRSFQVVLALAVVVGAIAWLANNGDSEPDHCGIAADLQQARLLDSATNSVSRGDCETKAKSDLDNARRRAAQGFADGQVYAAAAKAARVQKDKQAARKADLKAASALTAGLAENSEPTAQHDQLNATLDEVAKTSITPDTIPPVERVCALGQRMVDAGLLREAERAIGAAAQSDLAEACAETRKALLGASATATRKERLAATADEAKARGHHAAALRADGSVEAAKTALLDAAGESGSDSYLDQALDWLDGIPEWLGDHWEAILIFLVGLALVAAGAFWALRRLAWESAGPRRWITSRGSWGRRIAGLRVDFGDLDGGDEKQLAGKDATSLIAQALQAPSSSGFVFDRMPAAAGTDSVGAVADLLADLPSGKNISSVLKSVAPVFAQRSAKVAGRLIPPESGEAAIALTVAGPDERIKGTVIGERFVNPEPGGDAAARWRQIIPAAAAWIRHELLALTGRDGADADADAWRAEALAEVGKQWSAKQQWERAATCFTRALNADPTLLPAINNLAVVEIRRGRYEIAIQHLSRLVEKLDGDISKKWPALREAALYNLTLAIVYAHAQ